MKCLCGYEYVRGIDKEDNKGDESFIDIRMPNEDKPRINKSMGEWEEVYLRACPKCKTVKMGTWLD